MAFAEDLSMFFADFGVAATLDGGAATVMLDTSSVDDFDVITQAPSALMPKAEASAAAAGQLLVVAAEALPAPMAHLAGTYAVRAVKDEPPDAAFVRLELARV
jgi:hypothetical protein